MADEELRAAFSETDGEVGIEDRLEALFSELGGEVSGDAAADADSVVALSGAEVRRPE